jgi:hypothetical protein
VGWSPAANNNNNNNHAVNIVVYSIISWLFLRYNLYRNSTHTPNTDDDNDDNICRGFKYDSLDLTIQ